MNLIVWAVLVLTGVAGISFTGLAGEYLVATLLEAAQEAEHDPEKRRRALVGLIVVAVVIGVCCLLCIMSVVMAFWYWRGQIS